MVEEYKPKTFKKFIHRDFVCKVVQSPFQAERMLRESMGIKHDSRLQGPNGYVGISKDHPWYGVGYGRCLLPSACEIGGHCEHSPVSILDVHGGITYTGPGWWKDGLWYFGFDTGHAWETPETQSLDYVARECASLAEQLDDKKAYVDAYREKVLEK